MSTGVAGGGGVDGTVTVVTTTGTGAEEHNATNTSTGSAGPSSVGNKTTQLTLTPRFTQEEKEILYSLFHEHEEVIDIKFRKKQRSKYSVRDAWENIVREFNSHPGVSAVRNLKQIQKFWLNARLRKQYPFRPNGQKEANNSQTSIEATEPAEVVNHIKDEPDFQLTTADAEDHGSQNETFEEIEMDTGDGVGQLEQEHIEPLHQQQQQQQQQQQHHVLQHHVQQQQNIQTQQISVDQISAEKLTLNDLLHFKTTRPREDIILQIKHPSDSTTAHITIPSPTRITIPSQHQPQQHTITAMPAAAYNQQIISEIKPQQITLAQYQAQQLQQQQLAQHQLAVAAQQQQHQHQQQQQQQQQQQHQVKMQLQSPATAQFATATPTFTCTTLHALPVATAPAPAPVVPTVTVSNAAAAAAPSGNTTITVESFEEKVNYFRLKEAELRFKEVQVVLEKKKIELNRAQEELKHLREVHRLQVEELKMKIRILQEEEKILRKSPGASQL